MGASVSQRRDSFDADNEKKQDICCFCLPSLNPAQSSALLNVRKKNKVKDQMGSPLPSPAAVARERRKQVPIALPQPLYAGLEQEVPANSDSKRNKTSISLAGSARPFNNNLVHDGPNAERLLYQTYVLHEAIGVGSTSTVHRCERITDGQSFACKIIDVHSLDDRFQQTQFETEISALRQLNHPNIIRLYDVYSFDNKIYIVQEWMQGGEIFDFVVQKGTLTEDEASHIVRNVTSALVYMHQHHIVHRDLKPENLLLKRKPLPNTPASSLEVKIIDFGLSKALREEAPMASTFLGTRGYLAPEMLQRREYTKAVDTWALGVIVFVLLCGCLPFDDDSAAVLSEEGVSKRFTLRFPRWAKNVSTSAKDLLQHLLETNPNTRYTAEQALQHPWVQGTSVAKGNYLASPGRIKASPGNARTKLRALANAALQPPAQIANVPGAFIPPKRNGSI